MTKVAVEKAKEVQTEDFHTAIKSVSCRFSKACVYWANYQHSLENLQATAQNIAAYENSVLFIQYCS